ncbi:MAG: transposase [Elusimicrobia bacterium]|nr:transposase [Elusimicrobiota bacterium]
MEYRKNIRLKNYNYRANGYYFVTICCSCRAQFCPKYSEIIENHLRNFNKYAGVRLDYYKLMPNHLHFILILEEAKLALCRYIQNFKSKTTLEIKKNGFIGKRFWQPNYYEHIIKNENALYKIREYIQNNPFAEKLDWVKLEE